MGRGATRQELGTYAGGSAFINTWNVHVRPNEYSASSIFVLNGDNYIAVRWKVCILTS